MFFIGKKIKKLTNKIKQLEQKILKLEQELVKDSAIINTNIIRLKNNYEVNDQAILEKSSYIDITAFKAHEIFQEDDSQFMILDICDSNFERPCQLPGVVNIPFDELSEKLKDIPSKTMPIYILSERGINSIHACEILSKKGFYNTYNVSGGYEKLPRPKIEGLGQTLD